MHNSGAKEAGLFTISSRSIHAVSSLMHVSIRLSSGTYSKHVKTFILSNEIARPIILIMNLIHVNENNTHYCA